MPRRLENAVHRALERRTRHGIGDLLEEVVEVREIELNRIAPNPRQPRQQVDADGIEQLARSIEAHGLLQPVVVRRTSDGFELVAGSRRVRAVESLGRPRITAVVIKEGDSEVLALIENLQRADLDPIDEAKALVGLKEGRGCTLEALNQLVGKSISYLSEIMSLARLPETILEEARVLAAAGRPVPRASLIELTRIKDEDAQVTAWRAISTGVYDRATVRAFRKGSNSKPDTDVRPTLHVLAQRVERLTESLARTHGDAGWGQAELRQALLNLRSRIDLLLGEVG